MSKLPLTYPVLCLVTNPEIPDLVARVEVALSAGVNMLQLRGHTLPAAELYRLALVLRPLCQRYRAVFIINDRIDVGLVAGADGFQLGARSLPLAAARQLVGENYLLGASVHSREEALRAEASGADFLLAGTIFASHTHPNEPPCGIDLLHAICGDASRRGVGLSPPSSSRQKAWAGTSERLIPCGRPRPYDNQVPTLESRSQVLGRHLTCPLLAIGGITQANAKQVMQAGADGIAVITAILGSANVKQAVSELRMTINL